MRNLLAVMVIFLFALVACAQPEMEKEVKVVEKVVEKVIVQCWDGSTAESIEQCPPKPEEADEMMEEPESMEVNETQEMNETVSEEMSETSKVKVSKPAGQIWEVTVKNWEFVPQNLTIKSGDTVVWTQIEETPHTVTWAAGPEKFDSGVLRKDKKFNFTFYRYGTYMYKSEVYTAMRGKILVE